MGTELQEVTRIYKDVSTETWQARENRKEADYNELIIKLSSEPSMVAL